MSRRNFFQTLFAAPLAVMGIKAEKPYKCISIGGYDPSYVGDHTALSGWTFMTHDFSNPSWRHEWTFEENKMRAKAGL